MKKFLYGAAVFFLAVSCTGKSSKESEKVDSQIVEDTTVISADTAMAPSQVSSDSIVPNNEDKVKEEVKKEESSEYGKLVDQYSNAVNSWGKNAKNGNWTAADKASQKASQLWEKIEKVKNKLTPAERKKYDKANKTSYRYADMYQ